MNRFTINLRLFFWLALIGAGLLVVVPLAAQETTPEAPPAGSPTPVSGTATPSVSVDASRLIITRLDDSAFPFIAVDLIVNDRDGARVTNLGNLAMRENGTPILDFTIADTMPGLDVLFVVDANSSILSLDDDTGRTRLDKVKDSLIRFATQFMDPTQSDHASVIVPDGEEAAFLAQDVTRPGDLVEAVEGYTVTEPTTTPLQEMMTAAMAQAETTTEAGRYQAVVLFTDGATINNQLEYDTLLTEADRLGITFYVVILGARADDNEIDNAEQLTVPTSGRVVHMPAAPDTDELYTQLQDNGTQAQVTYRSTLADSGNLRLQVNVGEAQDSVETTITLAPPQVALLPTVTTIRRAGTQPDTPLNALQPAIQPLEAQITWPGGQPVSLSEVLILVNGEPDDPVAAPIVTGDNILRLDWDISNLDAGTYAVGLQLTDALGRTSESVPLAITIEVTRPVPPTTATISPAPATPVETPAGGAALWQNPTLLLLAGLGGVFLLVLLLLLLVRRRRRRRKAWEMEQALVAAAEAEPAGADEGEAEKEQPYLVILPSGPEPERPIPLLGDDITIGRDPKLVQIPLADRSISRLHARIRRRKGEYWLYDEGSATGTYLNFNRIGLAPQMLQEGDEVHIGRVHLRFHRHLPGQHDPRPSMDETEEESGFYPYPDE